MVYNDDVQSKDVRAVILNIIIEFRFIFTTMENHSVSSSSDNGDTNRQAVDAQILRKKKQRNNLRAQRTSVMAEEIKNFHISHRKQQHLGLFWFQIIQPLMVAVLHAIALTEVPDDRDDLVIIPTCCFITIGLFVTVYTNLQVTSLEELLLLYFHLDNIMPVLACSYIGIFKLIDFLDRYQWYYYWMLVVFPIWLIYFAGNLRVTIKHVKWQRWKIMVYKVSVVSGGVCAFYTGVHWMNGNYKVTNGYLIAFETTLKNLVLIYVFAMAEMYFQIFRRISQFDQTYQLQSKYEFKGENEKSAEIYQRLEQRDLEAQQICLDVKEKIASKKSIQSSKKLPKEEGCMGVIKEGDEAVDEREVKPQCLVPTQNLKPDQNNKAVDLKDELENKLDQSEKALSDGKADSK